MIIDIVLFTVLFISCVTDLLYQKIFNLLIFCTLVFAMVFYIWVWGLTGLTFSLAGLALGIALFFVPFILGGLGAGDVKLLGVVGALKGAEFVLYSFLLTAILGGIFSLSFLLYKGKLRESLFRIIMGVKIFVFSRGKLGQFLNLEEEKAVKLPYGVAIALGTFTAYWVM